MPDPEKNNHWNRLVDAARKVGATSEGSPTPKVTSSFVSNVVAMRKGLWGLARTILWRRWSLIAALLAITIYMTFFFLLKSRPPSSPTLPPAPAETLPPPPDSLP